MTRNALGAPSQTPLRKVLTTRLLYFFILGDVLGAGVYVLIGEVAGKSGGAVWVPLTAALLLALLTAASYAELATKYPRAGGASHYATRAFGPVVGFLAGYCMLAAGIVSVAALARGFAGDYLGAFVTLPVAVVAVVFLGLLALLNARGIRESTRANTYATLIETGGLLLVIGLGAWVLLRGDGDLGRLTQLGTDTASPMTAVLAGAVLAYYSFVGFETSVNVAEETLDPRRSYPKALFGALLTAGLVYAAVGAAASAAVPTDVLASSDGPLLEVVKVAGGVPEKLFALIALVAVANGALLTGIMTSRLAYGMSREGLLPAFLTRVLPERRTPWAAVAATTALSALLATTGEVDVLAGTLVLLLLAVFLTVNTAVLVLRRDSDAPQDHFRTPTAVPVLGALSCVGLATQIEAEVWLRGLVLLAVGVALGALTLWQRRRAGAATPSA
ncbi:APC family permease [Streptomyces fulvorobeus]|uniref:Amino acid transporter n=1 Tax=Streptomyces fulvorobeus TaxID=284028 RepID=A0A7J0C0V9_9ACTN|nr:APC family permease [Streptomyces fulvorobeus]NYE39386.1 amino acid transporter [Streptomyces fulvorobeus]GFM95614.1 amino acid transporter [Streptomyces fulvorobeus]